MTTLFCCIFAYLLGSIPSGLVLTRLFTNVDIHREGSGNIGATNVRRTAGTFLGLMTLCADVAKGLLPVYLVQSLPAISPGWREAAAVLTALCAFWGHLFPLYLKCRSGGKGVATAGGAFGVLSPPAVLISTLVFVLCVLLSRKVSLGSLIAAASLPLSVYWFSGSFTTAAGAAVAFAFIVGRHRENIRRLLSGTEPSLKDVRRR